LASTSRKCTRRKTNVRRFLLKIQIFLHATPNESSDRPVMRVQPGITGKGQYSWKSKTGISNNAGRDQVRLCHRTGKGQYPDPAKFRPTVALEFGLSTEACCKIIETRPARWVSYFGLCHVLTPKLLHTSLILAMQSSTASFGRFASSKTIRIRPGFLSNLKLQDGPLLDAFSV